VSYALLSAVLILLFNRELLVSITTVQEKAYRRWFKELEPQLWTNQEITAHLPSISIFTSTNKYVCTPKPSNCSNSITQEQILRYLGLIDVSRAMRLAEPLLPPSGSIPQIEIRVYQGSENGTSTCQVDTESIARSLGKPLFTGIVVESEGGIILRNLLSNTPVRKSDSLLIAIEACG
jgi:hypothetical protein